MGGKNQPDFGEVAVAQGEANEAAVRDQLYANRPTQLTPWGYTSWQANPYTDPGSGEQTTQWQMTQGLTPELQQILNKQIALQGARTDIAGGLAGRMGSEFGTPMNWEGLSPLQSTPQTQFTLPEMEGVGDPYQTRDRAENAMYQSAMSRIAPQQASERQSLEIKMRNQGLSPGDEAWNAQMQNLGNKHTDQQNQALWSSVGEGRAEAGQMFGQQMGRSGQAFGQALGANQQNFAQQMQAANYANQIRQQQLTEAMQQRGFSLNEINALMSGQQVNTPQMPNFMGASQAQPAPIYQGAVDNYNADQAGIQNWMNFAGGLGQAGLGAWGMGG